MYEIIKNHTFADSITKPDFCIKYKIGALNFEDLYVFSIKSPQEKIVFLKNNKEYLPFINRVIIFRISI